MHHLPGMVRPVMDWRVGRAEPAIQLALVFQRLKQRCWVVVAWGQQVGATAVVGQGHHHGPNQHGGGPSDVPSTAGPHDSQARSDPEEGMPTDGGDATSRTPAISAAN